jgi:two-component system, NarL family, invasion response regulator UvrY
MSAIKVMLVDDHQLLVDGFKATLREFGINVVEAITSADKIRESYKRAKPDVLVLDVRFSSGENGLDLCEKIMAENKNARVVILSQFDQDYIVERSYKVGALAFVKKDEDVKYLIEAISSAKDGKEYFTPSIAQRLARLSTIVVQPLKVLDKKELAVFILVADGMNHIEAANELNLSIKTIGNLLRNIKSKLNIERTAEFTKLAIKYDLINLD